MPRPTAVEAELASARHELQLAIFLNKGILQSNTEQSLRITELEAENAILRKAESRLSKTEDKLEEAEKELSEAIAAQEELVREQNGLLHDRMKVEGVAKSWESRYWNLKRTIEAALAQDAELDQVAGRDPEPSASTSRRGRGRPPIARGRESDHLTPVAKARATSTRRPTTSRQGTQARAVTPAREPEPEVEDHPTSRVSVSPIRPPARGQSKRRRRVDDSPSDDEAPASAAAAAFDDSRSEDNASQADPLGSFLYKHTPPLHAHTPTARSQPSSNKKSRQTPSATKRKESNRQSQLSMAVPVKAEPVSPNMGASDSEEDPLAAM
ncbi:hypothetical protein IAU60_004761 [Kwoniella sp. DSM 27419]